MLVYFSVKILFDGKFLYAVFILPAPQHTATHHYTLEGERFSLIWVSNSVMVCL